MIQYLSGKEPAQQILESVANDCRVLKEEYNVVPRLDVIYFAGDPASERYVRNKQKDADKVGINCVIHTHAWEPNMDESIVQYLNQDPNIHGIMVQLPFATKKEEYRILNMIAPEKDVDGLSVSSIGLRAQDPESAFWPCTPEGIIELLKYYDINFIHRRVAVVGRSNLVGMPLAQLFTRYDATVTLYYSKSSSTHITFDLPEADIICLCTGAGDHFNVENLGILDHPKKHTFIIDVGISFNEYGKMIGDFDPTGLQDEYDVSITPVPGGIGLMTRAILMKHVVEATKRSLG